MESSKQLLVTLPCNSSQGREIHCQNCRAISWSFSRAWMLFKCLVSAWGGPDSRIHSINLLICLTTGQVITASIADIIANYSFKDILRKLAGEKQTEVAPASYDDSYLGEMHCLRYLWFLKRKVYEMLRQILSLTYLIIYGTLWKFS